MNFELGVTFFDGGVDENIRRQDEEDREPETIENDLSYNGLVALFGDGHVSPRHERASSHDGRSGIRQP